MENVLNKTSHFFSELQNIHIIHFKCYIFCNFWLFENIFRNRFNINRYACLNPNCYINHQQFNMLYKCHLFHIKVLKYSQSDWNKMKQDLELEFQAKLLNKEREFSKKLGDHDKKLSQIDEQNKTLKHSNQEMR